MGPKDPLAWAKHPASDIAAREVLALARTDRRFAQIARVLIEEGVINRSGRLLLTIEGELVDPPYGVDGAHFPIIVGAHSGRSFSQCSPTV